MHEKLAQISGREKGILLQGSLTWAGGFDKLKMCTINAKTITKVIHQRLIANKSTEEIK